MNDENDEVRAEYIRAMGAKLGGLFHDLSSDFDWLRHKWREQQALFGGGAERIELLNRVASNFFYLLNKMMFEDLMLHLSRLTDRENPRHDQLTLGRLAGAITDPSVRDQVLKATGEVAESCKFARAWRDRRLTHNDLKYARGRRLSPLPDVDASSIRGALVSIEALFDIIIGRYSTPSHPLPPSALGGDPFGAKSLLYYLEKAIRAEDAENLESAP